MEETLFAVPCVRLYGKRDRTTGELITTVVDLARACVGCLWIPTILFLATFTSAITVDPRRSSGAADTMNTAVATNAVTRTTLEIMETTVFI